MRFRLQVVVLSAVLPALAGAADMPLPGKRLVLKDTPKRQSAAIDLISPMLAAPFPDPTTGATLIISGGAGPGQCRVEIPLDPGGWTPIGHDGPGRGYRYRKDAPGTQGVRRIVLRTGTLTIRASGAGWPCDLSAASERLPLTVVLRVGGSRFCGAFDNPSVLLNEAGRFRARNAAAPGACPKADLTVATLNVLHGAVGAGCLASNHCRLPDRVDLVFQWIAARGCPDIVTLQEVSNDVAALVPAHLATTCPFTYQVILNNWTDLDDEMILTRYPAVATDLKVMLRMFRTVLFARIDHPLGPVDVFTTHLASGSDGGNQPCPALCPAECLAAGVGSIRECHAVQTVNYVLAKHDVPTPAVITGDFNASPGSAEYNRVVAPGFTDTYLAAGGAECQPLTGAGCTSGRMDEDLSQLESPAGNENERIDYIFLVPPAAGSTCSASLDSPTDADGDGTGTRLFADQPNPFGGTCGPAPDPICWPSDHEGMELDLGCN